MDQYQWLGSHDPIRIDSNLAHIDFDDFKNEDLQNAFAYSIHSIDGESSSGTDMSICKSEQLFSSFKELGGDTESIIQDSLTQEDFNYSNQVKVNKNAYTLTYSALAASSGPHDTFPDEGKLTTWSNVMKQKETTTKVAWDRVMPATGPEVPRPGPAGEENNNDLADSNRKSRSLPNISKPLVRAAWAEEEKFTRETSLHDEPRLLNLYMRGRADRNSWNGEGSPLLWEEGSSSPGAPCSPLQGGPGAKGSPGAPLGVKEKDAINEYLRKSRLTSIDENTDSSADENTVRPVPTPRQRSVTSMSTTPSQGTSLQSATPPLSSTSFSLQGGSAQPGGYAPSLTGGYAPSNVSAAASSKRRSTHFPELDFLEDDCALWDAFFTNSRTGGKHSSILRPTLPVEDYLRRTGSAAVRDVNSLRVLLPSSQQHLLPNNKHSKSPISQVCESLSRLSASQYNNDKELEKSRTPPVEIVKVTEKWAPEPEQVQGYINSWERRSSRENLNLVNNNNASGRGRAEGREDTGVGRRATSAPRRAPREEGRKEEKVIKRRSYHPQDGLFQLLKSPSENSRRSQPFPKSGSQGNLCDSWLENSLSSSRTNPASPLRESRPGSRKGCAEYPFVPSLSFPNTSINFDLTHKRGLFVKLYTAVERLLLFQDPSPSYSNRSAARCVLLHEFCPALHAILEDGLKEEVITSFGRMKTSVWRVLEAICQAGPAQRSTCDLVMLLNTKFSSEEDFKKFSGFVIGMLNMSSLHLWFSKLKWSMDTLVRFYQRHAFICALHKETKLLFDELIFCLQRLFSLELDIPFNSGILEEIPGGEIYKKREHCANCACGNVSQNSSGATTPGSGTSSRSSGRTSRSRIPRPVSLPKRLEEKLSVRNKASPARASSQGSSSGPKENVKMRSPLKPPPRPKSRVRDTIKLFDAKYKPARGSRSTPTKSRPLTSPKTGGGEGMAGDSMEDKYK